MKWEAEYRRMLKSRLPQTTGIDMSEYNYKYDAMGRESTEYGYTIASICIFEPFSTDFNLLSGMIKTTKQHLISNNNIRSSMILFSVKENLQFDSIMASFNSNSIIRHGVAYFGEGDTRLFVKRDIIKSIVHKNSSLCVLITDNPDLTVDNNILDILKNTYRKIITLHFSDTVTVSSLK